MKSLQADKATIQGRAIAQGMHDVKVEQEKNMARAAKRRETMLERAAENVLSGGVQRRRP